MGQTRDDCNDLLRLDAPGRGCGPVRRVSRHAPAPSRALRDRRAGARAERHPVRRRSRSCTADQRHIIYTSNARAATSTSTSSPLDWSASARRSAGGRLALARSRSRTCRSRRHAAAGWPAAALSMPRRSMRSITGRRANRGATRSSMTPAGTIAVATSQLSIAPGRETRRWARATSAARPPRRSTSRSARSCR